MLATSSCPWIPPPSPFLLGSPPSLSFQHKLSPPLPQFITFSSPQASSEDGLVACYDARKGGKSAPLYRLSAHDRPACALTFCTAVPGLLATASTDKQVLPNYLPTSSFPPPPPPPSPAVPGLLATASTDKQVLLLLLQTSSFSLSTPHPPCLAMLCQVCWL